MLLKVVLGYSATGLATTPLRARTPDEKGPGRTCHVLYSRKAGLFVCWSVLVGWGLFLINSHCPGFTLGNIPAWTKSVNLIKSLPFRLQTNCFQLCLDSISSAWFSLILLGVVGSLQAVLTQFDDSRCAVTRASSTRAYSAPESRPRNKPAALCSIYFARVWYLPHRKSNEVG
jgi:hypothetical protein